VRLKCRKKHWIVLVMLICVSLVFSVGAHAYAVGEVLYHQDFSCISSAKAAGVMKGTAGSRYSVLSVQENMLQMLSVDDERTYALLPDVAWTESHTIEFTFRFTDVLAANGYMAFLLTCWGDKPENISAIVIRANGSIDGFGELSSGMVEKIQSGALIHVTIPIQKGVLHSITLESEEETCVAERGTLLRIGEGKRGFSVRNASAAVKEVYIVNGTGYTAKTGVYAEASFADDKTSDGEDVISPPTGDIFWISVLAVLCSVVFMGIYAQKNKYILWKS